MRTVALVLLLLLVGCADQDRAGADADAPSSSAPAEPTAEPTDEPTGEEPLPCVPGVEPFTGPAAERFGEAEVMAAHCWLVELALDQARTSLARPSSDQRSADLQALAQHLTPRAAAGWDRLVRARSAGDEAAAARVDGLLLHDVREVPAGYATEPGGPFLYGTRALPGTAALVRGGRALEVTFPLETGLVLLERGDTSGRHSLLPVTRTASYVLVPDGDGWLVDDWDAEFEQAPVRLATR